MSLDMPKYCDECHENVHTVGHAIACPNRYCSDCGGLHLPEEPHQPPPSDNRYLAGYKAGWREATELYIEAIQEVGMLKGLV